MSKAVYLSTIDNPYNPSKDFDKWLDFDMLKGYNCSAYLDRVAKTSDSLSDQENFKEIERAIDEIVKIDPTRMYCKVVADE